MPKRHKQEDHENHERWLVSYADFITLLFAFFVVMYAVSEVDAKKAKRLERSVQFAFNYAGTGGNDRLPIFDPPSGGSIVESFVVAPSILPVSPAELAQAERGALEQLSSDIESNLDNLAPYLDLGDVVQLSLEERGLIIRLSLDYLFDPGDDKLVAAARPVIDRIALALRAEHREVRVEGHADTRPIRSALFPSNWELSASRATGIVRYLMAQHGFAPERLSGSAYGEFRPIDTNDTAAGRARNRRVDIVVLSRQAEFIEPRPGTSVEAQADEADLRAAADAGYGVE